MIGGGIAGLATALSIRRLLDRQCNENLMPCDSAKVTLLESSPRLGGLIRTIRHPQFGIFDTSATAFSVRKRPMTRFNPLFAALNPNCADIRRRRSWSAYADVLGVPRTRTRGIPITYPARRPLQSSSTHPLPSAGGRHEAHAHEVCVLRWQ